MVFEKLLEIIVFKNDFGNWVADIKNYWHLKKNGQPRATFRNFGDSIDYRDTEIEKIQKRWEKKGFEVLVKIKRG